ncbi:hypothetical protein EGM87_17120 [Sphingobium sp. RSMS]|nr:hypothetical protein [Sphingobium sp. RSMS]UXC90720.1 hypothetical protein EGM87_17120 [Sphingobium sp. RSMS]
MAVRPISVSQAFFTPSTVFSPIFWLTFAALAPASSTYLDQSS